MATIVILGHPDDHHVQRISGILSDRDRAPVILDTSRFPGQHRISWRPGTAEGTLYSAGGIPLAFDEVGAVYWRSLDPPYLPELSGKPDLMIAQNDSYGLLAAFLRQTSIRWVNGLAAYEFHRVKPRQLSLAAQFGATIPKTLISNDAQDIVDFVATVGSAIYKPVQGGAHTEKLTERLLDETRLKKVLALSPVTIQEFVSGTNIRTYVIGDQVFSAEIRSQAVDFREDEQAAILPLETPDSIRALALKITTGFGMYWTAIDWRRRDNGEYVFLEANPSPMFYHFERITGYPLGERLADLLCQAPE